MKFPSSSSTGAPRGFVVLIVLLMLAVVSAVVVGQMSVVKSSAGMSVRREEEAQARALAEGCLLMMQRHAEFFQGGTAGVPPATATRDFDSLLNPTGGASADAATYLPAITGTRVTVPPALAGSDHQWQLVPRAGGACLLRYEDNSDDALPALATVTDTLSTDCPAEPGDGVDVTFCDRDGAIYMTAIGIFPFSGAASDAYARAHARVTLRKLFAVATPTRGASGVVAGGKAEFKNNTRICGIGGIAAGDVDGLGGGTSCICGPVTSTAVPGEPIPVSTACGGCTTPCNPGSLATGTATPRKIEINGDNSDCTPGTDCAGDLPTNVNDTDVYMSPMQPDMPTTGGGDYLQASSFANPRATTVTLGANIPGVGQTCELFFDDDGQSTVYYWDNSDLAVSATLQTLGVPLASLPGVVNENCATLAVANIPKPCTWTLPGAVSCAAGQSACWKPLAKLNSFDGQNLAVAGAAVTEMTKAAFPTAPENLQITAGPIPNIADPTLRFTGPSALLCGNPARAPSSCADCTTPPFVGSIGVAGGIFEVGTAGRIASNRTLPAPLMMVFNNRDVNIGAVGHTAAPASPLYATLAVQKKVNVLAAAGICCATCDCSAMALPAPGLRTLPTATVTDCSRTDTRVPIFPAFAGPAANAPAVQSPDIPGFAIKADDVLTINDEATLVGVTWGKDVTINFGANPCIVGRLVSDGNAAIGGAAHFVNDFMVFNGSIEGRNNVTVIGNIWSENNAKFKNNFQLIGRVYVNDDFEVKNNAVIEWDGGGGTSAFGSDALSSFMETQW